MESSFTVQPEPIENVRGMQGCIVIEGGESMFALPNPETFPSSDQRVMVALFERAVFVLYGS